MTVGSFPSFADAQGSEYSDKVGYEHDEHQRESDDKSFVYPDAGWKEDATQDDDDSRDKPHEHADDHFLSRDLPDIPELNVTRASPLIISVEAWEPAFPPVWVMTGMNITRNAAPTSRDS